MKVAAIIQARMQSQRLPGKVLQDICGKPLLAWIIERLRHCKNLDDIAIATTTDPSDDVIVKFANAQRIPCIRGPKEDVLGRYLIAAEKLHLSHVVRITGDAPFVDAEHVDSAVQLLVSKKADLLQCQYPLIHEGIDPCSVTLLKKIAEKTRAPQYREHILTYAWEHPELAKIAHYDPKSYEIGEGYHLSIDNVADLEFARSIYENFIVNPRNENHHNLRIQYSEQNYFNVKELRNFLKLKPEIRNLNAGVVSNKRRIPSGKNYSVLIVLEGGKDCGWGHLVRMKQLARELNAYFNCSIFLLAPDNPDCHHFLDYFGLPVQYLPSEDGTLRISDIAQNLELNQPFKVRLSQYLNDMDLNVEFSIYRQNFDLLIIDRQKRLTRQEATVLKKYASKMVVIDYAHKHLLSVVDAMIIPNVHSVPELSRQDWWNHHLDKCFAGEDFILLRESFRSIKPSNSISHLLTFTSRKNRNRFTYHSKFSYLLLNPGATDPFNFVQPLVKKLENHWPGFIVLIAGSLSENKLRRVVNKPRILIARPGSDEELIEWIDGAQLAVTLFGMFCYELRARNIPMLVLPHRSHDCKEAFYFCQECELAEFIPHVNAINPEVLQRLSQLNINESNVGRNGLYGKKTAQTIFDLVVNGKKVHH
ncbi:MAG: hypothetical protein D6813_08665 [Calditrichaeota bacterium]|nr:MAG: hypothetical protein D6813_08665 [Calditrichota bacterium]